SAARAAARPSLAVAPLGTLAALGVVAVHRPPTSPTWAVAAVALALATYEALTIVAGAADALVAVTGAAERLEALEASPLTGTAPFPGPPLLASRLRVAEGERTLVDGLDLEVGTGRRVAVVGPSGSGKSSLLRVLAGLDAPAGGAVTLDGVPVGEVDETSLRAGVALVAAEPGLTGGLAVDALTLGRTLARDPVDDLRRLGLSAGGLDRLDDASRGERQRVAVAQAIAPGPALVLLDEPTSGLGPVETDAVLGLLADAGVGVVVATHDPRVVAWCDEVVTLP
ncbi:MAG TPA: ATP-binding cassette domain-containing protein, partial [Acidimicrobiales bacterium]|nr:ATP-binding cassette domain-containing protein [Acidimicrobiales bacterium]